MFCPKCGNQLPDDAKFCGKCGSHIQEAPTAAAPAGGAHAAPSFAAAGKNASFAGTAGSGSLKWAAVVACVIGILAFLFLDVVSVSALGFSFGLSGMDFITGIKVMGYSVGGDAANVIYIVPFVVAAILAFVLKGKAKALAILEIVCGALALLLMIFTAVGLADEFGELSSLAIGSYLFIIAAIVLIVIGILNLKNAKAA